MNKLLDGQLGIVLDFDGVIHHYLQPWTHATDVRDGPTPGVIEWIIINSAKVRIHIHSSRSHQDGGIYAMQKAVYKWIHLVLSNHHETQMVMDRLIFPEHKPPAILSIDDRGFCFRGQMPPLEAIRSFRPWNKRPDGTKSSLDLWEEGNQRYKEGKA